MLAGHFFTVHFAAPGERQGNGELKGRKARGSVTLAAGAGSTGCTDGGQRAHVRFMNGPVAHNRRGALVFFRDTVGIRIRLFGQIEYLHLPKPTPLKAFSRDTLKDTNLPWATV